MAKHADTELPPGCHSPRLPQMPPHHPAKAQAQAHPIKGSTLQLLDGRLTIRPLAGRWWWWWCCCSCCCCCFWVKSVCSCTALRRRDVSAPPPALAAAPACGAGTDPTAGPSAGVTRGWVWVPPRGPGSNRPTTQCLVAMRAQRYTRGAARSSSGEWRGWAVGAGQEGRLRREQDWRPVQVQAQRL